MARMCILGRSPAPKAPPLFWGVWWGVDLTPVARVGAARVLVDRMDSRGHLPRDPLSSPPVCRLHRKRSSAGGSGMDDEGRSMVWDMGNSSPRPTHHNVFGSYDGHRGSIVNNGGMGLYPSASSAHVAQMRRSSLANPTFSQKGTAAASGRAPGEHRRALGTSYAFRALGHDQGRSFIGPMDPSLGPGHYRPRHAREKADVRSHAKRRILCTHTASNRFSPFEKDEMYRVHPFLGGGCMVQ